MAAADNAEVTNNGCIKESTGKGAGAGGSCEEF